MCACVCVRTRVHAQSCPTLCNAMERSQLVSSVHGILQARTLEWVAISYFRACSRHRAKTHIQHVQRHRVSKRLSWETKPSKARRRARALTRQAQAPLLDSVPLRGPPADAEAEHPSTESAKTGKGVLNELCELMGSEGPVPIILPCPCLIQEVVLKESNSLSLFLLL